MVRVDKREVMYKMIFVFIFLVVFMQACSLKDSSSYISEREYKVNEQKVFNIAKKMFESEDSEEYVIDTAWDNLVITQREIIYFVFVIRTKKLYYQLNAYPINEKDILYTLRVSTQVDEGEKEYYGKNSFLHTRFWDQIESALLLDPSSQDER